MEFEVTRAQLARFFRVKTGIILGIFFSPLLIFVFGMIFSLAFPISLTIEGASSISNQQEYTLFSDPLFYLTLLPLFGILFFSIWLRRFTRKLANSYQYRFEDNIIHIDQGVWNKQRNKIPIDRVTNIQLFQGLLMRQFNVSRLAIQTAGKSDGGAEGYLFGLKHPEAVLKLLLDARDRAAN